MKSNTEALSRRGYLQQAEIELLRSLPYGELCAKIHSPVAARRTAAVHLLAGHPLFYTALVPTVLDRLYIEKCLYTKLEICHALEKGTVDTARQMLPLLGRIGDNQHKQLPQRASKKVSFPLPRDIIARTLGNMAPPVFPALLTVLDGDDELRIAEVLDAIGYMAFYHQELAAPENAQPIFNLINRYKDHMLILWKAALCLSAFPNQETLRLLKGLMSDYPDTLIANEAERSTTTIQKRQLSKTQPQG